jgi:hypothetical protein
LSSAIESLEAATSKTLAAETLPAKPGATLPESSL